MVTLGTAWLWLVAQPCVVAAELKPAVDHCAEQPAPACCCDTDGTAYTSPSGDACAAMQAADAHSDDGGFAQAIWKAEFAASTSVIQAFAPPGSILPPQGLAPLQSVGQNPALRFRVLLI